MPSRYVGLPVTMQNFAFDPGSSLYYGAGAERIRDQAMARQMQMLQFQAEMQNQAFRQQLAYEQHAREPEMLERRFQLQQELNESELNQSEKIRLQKLNQGMAWVDNADFLTQEEKNDYKVELMGLKDPLQRRLTMTQMKKVEQQEALAASQAEKQNLLMQQLADFNAKKMPERIQEIVNPETQERMQFFEETPGRWKPVPWGQGKKEGAAGARAEKPIDELAVRRQALAELKATGEVPTEDEIDARTRKLVEQKRLSQIKEGDTMPVPGMEQPPPQQQPRGPMPQAGMAPPQQQQAPRVDPVKLEADLVGTINQAFSGDPANFEKVRAEFKELTGLDIPPDKARAQQMARDFSDTFKQATSGSPEQQLQARAAIKDLLGVDIGPAGAPPQAGGPPPAQGAPAPIPQTDQVMPPADGAALRPTREAALQEALAAVAGADLPVGKKRELMAGVKAGKPEALKELQDWTPRPDPDNPPLGGGTDRKPSPLQAHQFGVLEKFKDRVINARLNDKLPIKDVQKYLDLVETLTGELARYGSTDAMPPAVERAFWQKLKQFDNIPKVEPKPTKSDQFRRELRDTPPGGKQ